MCLTYFPSPRYLDWANAWSMPFSMRVTVLPVSARPLSAAIQMGGDGFPFASSAGGFVIRMTIVPITGVVNRLQTSGCVLKPYAQSGRLAYRTKGYVA